MQAGADIADRLWRAARRRRAPMWLGFVLPWCLLLSAPGVLATVALALWDGVRLHQRVAANWARWLDGGPGAPAFWKSRCSHADIAKSRGIKGIRGAGPYSCGFG